MCSIEPRTDKKGEPRGYAVINDGGETVGYFDATHGAQEAHQRAGTYCSRRDELEALRAAKRRALAIADERSKENCLLRQKIEEAGVGLSAVKVLLREVLVELRTEEHEQLDDVAWCLKQIETALETLAAGMEDCHAQ